MTVAPGPRIPLLPRAEWDAYTTELLGGAVPGGRQGSASNLLMTLAHDSSLLQLFMTCVRRLLVNSSLPVRDRELVVLRSAWLCQAAYAWAEHVRIARAAGLTGADIERVAGGPQAGGWDDFELALVKAVDQLHATATIDGAVWQVLASRYSAGQLIELPMLAGLYHLVSWTQNAAGIAPNPGSAGLAAR